MVNVFEYIAERQPDASYEICHKYGYVQSTPTNIGELVACMDETVAGEGEPALRDFMNLHPDKDVLIGLFGGSMSNQKKLNVEGNPATTFASPAPAPAAAASVAAAPVVADDKYISKSEGIMLAAAVIVAIAILAKK